MIYLRAADILDAPDLARLRAASLCELAILPPEHQAAFGERATRAFASLFRYGQIAAWVACDDTRVIGSCCAVYYDRLPYPEGSRHAEVCGVFVEPAYRRNGLASELLREVVALTRGDAPKVFLRPTNGARALYARLGFVTTELMAFDA